MSVVFTNSIDLPEWQTHRSRLEKFLSEWCNQNNIEFFGTYQTVKNTKFDKIVKVVFFELIDNLDSLLNLDNVLEFSGKKLYYLTDNIVDSNRLSQLKNITVISLIELFGMISLYGVDVPASPEKLYNCFVQRVDSVRQSWFYFLKHHNLLDKGYVSFLLFQHSFYSEKTGVDLFNYIHKHYELDNIAHFHRAYEELKSVVPYQNFVDNYSLNLYAKKSKYSLILETYAVEDDHVGFCYTEKTHRGLQTPTINLIFSQKNSLTQLSALGFKIDDRVLKIDQYPWIERQQKLLDILVNDSIDFDPVTLYNNALHNQDLISNYKRQLLASNFLDKILTEIIES
jgi:hypothetical protein